MQKCWTAIGYHWRDGVGSEDGHGGEYGWLDNHDVANDLVRLLSMTRHIHLRNRLRTQYQKNPPFVWNNVRCVVLPHFSEFGGRKRTIPFLSLRYKCKYFCEVFCLSKPN